ncbi:MAG: hypothetical protein HRU20_30225, partial [Pseudomonadales bacterium]|nr:hypothetical protein [Pseudomonadales bacterium]
MRVETDLIENNKDVYMSRFCLALILLASLASCSDNPDATIDTDGDGIGDMCDPRPEFKDYDQDDILDGLDQGGYNDAMAAAEFIGLAPDAITTWFDLRLCEVKAMLALA